MKTPSTWAYSGLLLARNTSDSAQNKDLAVCRLHANCFIVALFHTLLL